MDELQVLDTEAELEGISKKQLSKKTFTQKLGANERVWVDREWFNVKKGDYRCCNKAELGAMGVEADTFKTNIVPIDGFYGLGMAMGPETVVAPWYEFMIPTKAYTEWNKTLLPKGVAKANAWNAESIDAKVYALLVACKQMAVEVEKQKTLVNATPLPPDPFVIDEPIPPSPPEGMAVAPPPEPTEPKMGKPASFVGDDPVELASYLGMSLAAFPNKETLARFMSTFFPHLGPPPVDWQTSQAWLEQLKKATAEFLELQTPRQFVVFETTTQLKMLWMQRFESELTENFFESDPLLAAFLNISPEQAPGVRKQWREAALQRAQKAAYIGLLKTGGGGSEQAQQKLLHDATEKAKVGAKFAADMEAYDAAKAAWGQLMLTFNSQVVSPEELAKYHSEVQQWEIQHAAWQQLKDAHDLQILAWQAVAGDGDAATVALNMQKARVWVFSNDPDKVELSAANFKTPKAMEEFRAVVQAALEGYPSSMPYMSVIKLKIVVDESLIPGFSSEDGQGLDNVKITMQSSAGNLSWVPAGFKGHSAITRARALCRFWFSRKKKKWFDSPLKDKRKKWALQTIAALGTAFDPTDPPRPPEDHFDPGTIPWNVTSSVFAFSAGTVSGNKTKNAATYDGLDVYRYLKTMELAHEASDQPPWEPFGDSQFEPAQFAKSTNAIKDVYDDFCSSLKEMKASIQDVLGLTPEQKASLGPDAFKYLSGAYAYTLSQAAVNVPLRVRAGAEPLYNPNSIISDRNAELEVLRTKIQALGQGFGSTVSVVEGSMLMLHRLWRLILAGPHAEQPQDILLLRGVGHEMFLFHNLPNTFGGGEPARVGQSVLSRQFTSASVAEPGEFYGGDLSGFMAGGDCCLMAIKVLKGTPLLPVFVGKLSHYSEEREVILPPGLAFRFEGEVHVPVKGKARKIHRYSAWMPSGPDMGSSSAMDTSK